MDQKVKLDPSKMLGFKLNFQESYATGATIGKVSPPVAPAGTAISAKIGKGQTIGAKIGKALI